VARQLLSDYERLVGADTGWSMALRDAVERAHPSE